ncbi:MAG: hypothetical protein KC414_15335 [Romboutsia sp.]|nr:hypothetical protein [Romboutsia sp.]
MGYKVTGSFEKDFFEQNPELKLIKEFKELSNQKDASQIMWCIFLAESPQSRFYKTGTLEKRRKDIESTYAKIDWDKYRDISKKLIEITLSDAERNYKIWKDKEESFNKYVENLEVNATNMDEILKLFKNQEIIQKTMKEVEAELARDEQQDVMRGGGQQSAREKRYN